MKKTLSVAIISLIFSMNICLLKASTISVEEAAEIAFNFRANTLAEEITSKSNSSSIQRPELSYTAIKNGSPMVYIFNYPNGGFSIVSADNEQEYSVLAYSDTGYLDYPSAPDGAKAIIDSYANSINLKEKIASVKSSSTSAIAPLLGETAWAQEYPYNLKCPMISEAQCLTGCVPTAIAQIMYYHKYPAKGKGEVFYDWNNTQLSADLSLSTYNWDAMTPFYNEISTEESKQAVAQLMADVGYACETVFGVTGSSTSNLNPMNALVDHFDYDLSIQRNEKRFFSDNEWIDIIYRELENKQPILYTGSDENRLNHAYVCDGRDTDGLLHFNFGWGGLANGYYVLNSQNYGILPEIVCNIKPNEGGQCSVEGYCYTDFMYNGDLIWWGFKIMTGASTVPVEIATRYTNTETNEEKINIILNTTAYCWYEQGIPIDKSFNLDDGKWELEPVYRKVEEENNGWKKFHFPPNYQQKIDITVINGEYIIENNDLYDPIDEGTLQVDDLFYKINKSDKTATVTYKNTLRPSYIGNFIIPETITVNNETYTVTKIGDRAFEVCRGLKSVVIPNTVKEIGYGAFSQSYANSIIFEPGSQLEIIDQYAFNAMEYITSIELPKGLKEIRTAGLRGIRVNTLDIPTSVVAIGEEALDIYSLRDVILHWDTPLNASNITYSKCFTVHVPQGTESLYKQSYTWGIYTIDSKSSDRQKTIVEIGKFKYELYFDATVIGLVDGVKDSDILIPESITYQGIEYPVIFIGNESISESDLVNSTFETLTIPSSVRKIEFFSFSSWRNLKKVIIPANSNLIEIDQSVFNYCQNLTEISLPNSLKIIGFNSFGNCTSLKSLHIPGGVIKLNQWAFNNCSNLTDLYCHWLFPPTFYYLSYNPFEGCNNLTIRVPENSKRNYTSYESWKQYEQIIIEDTNLQPLVNIDVEQNFALIEVPEIEGATNYNVTLYDSNGIIVEIKQNQSPIMTQSTNQNNLYKFGTIFGREYSYRIDALSEKHEIIKNIEGYFNTYNVTTSIYDILETARDTEFKVYTTNGIYIKNVHSIEDAKSLIKGIYILKSENQTHKIIID